MNFKSMFGGLRVRFHDMLDAIVEAIIAVVTIILMDVYVVGNQSIINTSTTIGGIAKPIIDAALLIVAIIVSVMLIKQGAKQGKKGSK